jgi:hypothetical protein
MSDLIERLERWGRDEGLQNHFIGSRSARKDCAEAAAALAEAEATIARQQVMLDWALEASFDDKARADRAEAEIVRLRDALEMSREGWDNALELDLLPKQHRHSAKTMADVARAALSRPHATKGETG